MHNTYIPHIPHTDKYIPHTSHMYTIYVPHTTYIDEYIPHTPCTYMHIYILHTSSFTESGSTSVALNLWHFFFIVNCISSLDCAPLDHTSLGHTYLGTPIKGLKEVKVKEATEMTGMKWNS